MTLLERITSRYYQRFPARDGHTIPYPDWLPDLLAEIESEMAKKLDRLMPKDRMAPDE